MTETTPYLAVITPLASGRCVLIGDYQTKITQWVSSLDEFNQAFPSETPLTQTTISLYFENGGHQLIVMSVNIDQPTQQAELSATIGTFQNVDFIVLDPTMTWSDEWLNTAIDLADRHDAVYLGAVEGQTPEQAIEWLGRRPTLQNKHSVLYYPKVKTPFGEIGPQLIASAIFARLDQSKGPWASPAAANAQLRGNVSPTVIVDNPGTIRMNNLGINCIRSFKSLGTVLWGNTSAVGLDHPNMYWKYIQIRRTLHHIKKNIVTALDWVKQREIDATLIHDVLGVVEPFMLDLYVQGAFYGKTPPECYQLSCTGDGDHLRLVVGIVCLKPEEFIDQTILIPAKKSWV